MFLIGEIELSKIPKDLIEVYTKKNEKGEIAEIKKYLRIAIGDRKTPGFHGEQYNITCRSQDGQRFFIGSLKDYRPQPSAGAGGSAQSPSPDAGAVDSGDDLPF